MTDLADALSRYATDLDAVVASVVREAALRVPAFARRLAAAEINPGAVSGIADLDVLPVMTKDDMVERQRLAPPFGGLLATDAEVRRVFQSPGPLYEPQLAGADPWRWATALRSLGLGPGDVVLNCFGYHLSPAGAMFDEAALAVGAVVVPGGVGNRDLQARLVADAGVSAYIGLPSYLDALLESYDAAGLPEDRWRVRRALVTAEPLPDLLRTRLQSRVSNVRMAYGTAETGLLGFETGDGLGLRVPESVLVQVCDLATGGPVEDGTEGQVVVTLLRPDYPLVRFGTGDLSAWITGPDGEPRLAGVLGRIGAAVKVRGMFLHPRQVTGCLDGTPGVAAYRFVVDRVGHRDRLRCEIVLADGDDPALVAAEVHIRVRAGLRFDAEVVAVRTLPEEGSVIVDLRDWS